MKKTPIEKRGNFLIIPETQRGYRRAIAIPILTFISVETGVEIWEGPAHAITVDGWTIDEILDLIEGPAKSPIDHIREVADATVDAMAKDLFPGNPKTVPLPLITRNEDAQEWADEHEGEEIPRVGLRELQTDVHDLAREKGWWDGYERDDQGRLKLTTDQVISKIALIHAELSEAVEEARKSNYHGMYLGEGGKPEGFVVELADAVIRTLDLCGALGLDLEGAIAAKHEFNKTRPVRHGGKLA